MLHRVTQSTNNYVLSFSRTSTCSNLAIYGQTQDNEDIENVLLEFVRKGDTEALQELAKDTARAVQLQGVLDLN